MEIISRMVEMTGWDMTAGSRWTSLARTGKEIPNNFASVVVTRKVSETRAAIIRKKTFLFPEQMLSMIAVSLTVKEMRPEYSSTKIHPKANIANREAVIRLALSSFHIALK